MAWPSGPLVPQLGQGRADDPPYAKVVFGPNASASGGGGGGSTPSVKVTDQLVPR